MRNPIDIVIPARVLESRNEIISIENKQPDIIKGVQGSEKWTSADIETRSIP